MQAINEVNLSKKQFRLTDFKNSAARHENLIVQKEGVYGGYGAAVTDYYVNAGLTERLYRVGGRFFAYYSDGSFYECEVDGLKNELSFGQAPELIEVIYHGERCVLIVGGSKAYILGSDGYQAVNLPETNLLTVHNGRLFTANQSLITFSDIFDFYNQTTVFSGGGTISLAPSSGDVVGFYSKDRKLYIICSKAIYRLTTFGESIDFNLEKLPVPSLCVEKGSVCALYDVCIFVSSGKLYALSDTKVSRICALPDQVSGAKFYKAAVMQDAYLLPLENDGKNYVFVYDYLSGGESLVKTGSAVVTSGGYVINENGMVLRLDVMGDQLCAGQYVSLPLNFNLLQKKTVLEINAFVGSKCELTVASEYGKKTFSLKKGYNRRKLNLDGNEFIFTVAEAGIGFCLSEVRVDYAVRGNYAI